MVSQEYEDDNLFEVDDAHGLQEMQDMSIGDSENSKKEFRLHRLPETIIEDDTRQPIPGSSKATSFARSPTDFHRPYRRRSMEFETNHSYSPPRLGESPSAAASRRRPRGISDQLVRDNNGYTSKRDSLSTVYSLRSSRPSSPMSADGIYLEAAQRARSTSKDYGMN
ncbi:hypothetical protein BGX34_004205, partial [Mortierella sp. NVP85]